MVAGPGGATASRPSGDGEAQLGGKARLGSARPGSASHPHPSVVWGLSGSASPRWWALIGKAVLDAWPQVMFLGYGKKKGSRVGWQPQRVARCVLLNKTLCSQTQ